MKRLQSSTWNLPVDHIDTDQIIPAQFLTTTERAGLGRHLFHNWRFDDQGSERPDHPLAGHDPTSHVILVAGTNFGCGSSREHAPWALLDYGFQAVISSRFADIFRNNALKNGLLPVQADAAVIEHLLTHPGCEVTIDLEPPLMHVEGLGEFEFPLDAFSGYCLTRGIDALDFLRQHEADIAAHEARTANHG